MSDRQIIIWTLVLTPTLLLLSVFSMGGGHGTYFLGKLFYPISMIISGINNQITNLAIAAAVIQLPVYGLILHRSKKNRKKIGKRLLICHFVLFIIAFLVANKF